MGKTSCKKGQYYCNTDKKCKPIPEGYIVREDGFLVKEGWSAKYKKSIDCNNIKSLLIAITQKVLVRKHIVQVRKRK